MISTLTRNAFVAGALVCSVTADFHLINSDRYDRLDYFTCPSNYWTEKCWCSGDRRSSSAFVEKQTNGEWKVKLEDICGVRELDFWWRPNGANGDSRIQWEVYVPNADGHVVATCYSNGGRAIEPDCWIGFPIRYTAFDGWVCYSEICGHA
jgi:hypothetical protein